MRVVQVGGLDRVALRGVYRQGTPVQALLVCGRGPQELRVDTLDEAIVVGGDDMSPQAAACPE